MGKALRLLLVEDSESDAELIVRRLTQAGYDVVPKRVQDAESMRLALAGEEWDLIISDYSMPGFDAPGALSVFKETGRDIPFLIVSGTIGEDTAVAMMKAGAHDYLMKDNLARLGAAVDRELRDAATRAQAAEALRRLKEGEAQLELAIDGIFDFDPRTGKIFYSDLARRHLLLPEGSEPTLENFFKSLHPEDRPRVERAVDRVLQRGSDGRYAEEYRTKTPAGLEERWLSAWGKVLFDAGGNPARFLGVVRDITERKRAQQQLQFQLRLTACITEQSAESIVLTDRDGLISFVNPAAEQAFGYTPDEFRGNTPHELLHYRHPDGRPYPASECTLFRHMTKGEAVRDLEFVFFHKNGTPIEVLASCVPLDLGGERVGFVYTCRDITESKRIERALRRSDERFRSLFDADIIGIMISDRTHIVESNDYFLRLLGYTREEFAFGKVSWLSITPPEYADVTRRAVLALSRTGVCLPFEKEYIRKDGTRVPVLFTAVELSGSGDSPLLCFIVDLTERRNLEDQFRQSQKLESIGQLAGGVAHDFNNLLTVIMGYSSVMLAAADRSHPFHRPLQQISEACETAAALTTQLLTFSRLNPTAPKNLRLDSLVTGIEQLVRRLIGEQIEVILSLRAGEALIHADPHLVEQVIVNLAVNARDAMPEGGRLFIETARITVADDFAALSLSVPLGAYVSLEVTDTGTGMTPEVQARLFEPFFTTKEPGKGTGLGLSTVYGIVRQSGGSIKVHSTEGIGTSVRIMFPLADGEPDPEIAEPSQPLADGTETVLVVEDDPAVRRFISQVLEAHGYRSLDFENGADALELAARYGGPIHLLLTDIGLPGMKGAEVIRQFAAVRPDVPALSMSGYSERFGAQTTGDTPHLQKPFTADTLLRRIRQILDRPK